MDNKFIFDKLNAKQRSCDHTTWGLICSSCEITMEQKEKHARELGLTKYGEYRYPFWTWQLWYDNVNSINREYKHRPPGPQSI